MYLYRVTKYNSALRDRYDAYTGREWASRREVGKVVDGHLLTEDEYLATENKYLYAFEAFAHESGVRELTLKDLFIGPTTTPEWRGLREGQRVSLDQAVELVRIMLREGPLTTLLDDGDRFYAHVGDNLYLWIGSEVDCVNAVAEAERIGLFVDRDIPSPLWDDGERYWWLREGAPVQHVLFAFTRDGDEPGGQWAIPDAKVDAVRGLVTVAPDDKPFYDNYDVDDARVPELAAVLGLDLNPGPVYYRVGTRSVEA
jgi:hypothetical protein